MSEPSGSAAPVPEARKSIGIVWTVIFLDLLGFGIVLPSLAYFVHLFPMPQFALDAGARLGVENVGAVFVGLIQTSYSLFQLVFAPLWGRLSDRVGRRPVLVASMAGFTVAWTIFALAPSMGWLLVSRSFAGAFGANVSTAQAYIADVYPKEKRARGMGLIGMAFGIGFVFGPALGALLASDLVLSIAFAADSPGREHGRLLIPGLFAASFSLAAFLLAFFRLRESLPKEARATVVHGQSEIAELFSALRQPGIGPMLVVYFVIILGFANLESMFSQFNYDHLHLPQSTNGLVFTLIGLTLAAVQGGLIGRLTSRFGSAKLLMFGLAGLSVSMTVFGFQMRLNPGLPPMSWLLISAMVSSACFSLCNPSVLGIISSLAKDRSQGGTMGFTSSSATLGRIAGPLIGGVAYGAFGPEWPFAIGGVLIAVALLIFVVFRPRS